MSKQTETTHERLRSALVNCGMFPDHADAVIARAKADLEDGYIVTWDRSADEYPPQLFALWFYICKPHALAWIDENLPKAWFRPMFEVMA